VEYAPEDDPDRLRGLDAEAFQSILRSFVKTRWGVDDADIDVSPPSPGRGTDVVVPGHATIVHARRYAQGAISANELRDLALLRDRRTLDTLVVVTTTGFTDDALDLASEADIECIDGRRLSRLLARYGVAIPEASEPAGLSATVAELAVYWPDPLQETAQEVVACIDRSGELEYGLDRADYSTDLDVIPAGADRPTLKLRFSTAGLLLYARRPTGWQRVVAVSAHGGHRPSDLLDRVRAAVEESLDSSA
jgi:hypothetical protein